MCRIILGAKVFFYRNDHEEAVIAPANESSRRGGECGHSPDRTP
ncbi:hypothetical protein [Methylotuvimicrobium sp. KM1]